MAADTKFYYAAMLVPPWAAAFIRASVPNPNANNDRMGEDFLTVAVDAGHCTGPGGGVLLQLVTTDANRQLVVLAFGHFADNECDKSFDTFLRFVKQNLPELDISDIRASSSPWPSRSARRGCS